MAGNLDYLEPRVGQILRAPGTDLSTISAKRVRKQLLDLDPSLTPEFVKEHKDKIDLIISRVFEQVSAENAATNGDVGEGGSSDRDDSSTSPQKRRRDERPGHGADEEEDDDEEDRPARPPAKKVKKSTTKSGQKISDEELARKLSYEINGRSTRTSGKNSTKARPAKSSKSKKSSETVESDGEGGGQPSSRGRAKGGFGKEFMLSEALGEVVQASKLSRPQVVKMLWVYIKENELQNPSDKREIICDTKLKAVFGMEKVDMFTMNKIIGKHLHEDDTSY